MLGNVAFGKNQPTGNETPFPGLRLGFKVRIGLRVKVSGWGGVYVNEGA